MSQHAPPGSLNAENGSSAFPAEDHSRKHLLMWRMQRLATSIDLDTPTLLKMMKGALPPTIAVAIYQSSAISNITTTVGYITALITVASQCLLPRAKFMKVMFFNLLATCGAAALSCLAVFCALKARRGNDDIYNSNACVVSAVWLLFAIWISNTLRAYRQAELQDPMVAFSIFSGIILTRSGRFLSLSEGLDFTRQLLLAFLLGFAIATGVSLLILPITSRRNASAGILAYSRKIQDVLEAETAYLKHGLANLEPRTSGEQGGPSQNVNTEHDASRVDTLKASMAILIGTHDKLHSDLIYVKSEIAWGKLDPADFQSIFALLRSILLPLAGMSMLPDIIQAHRQGWRQPSKESTQVSATDMANFERLLQPLETRLAETLELVMMGVHHALIALEIAPQRTHGQLLSQYHSNYRRDLEAGGATPVHGEIGFCPHFERQVWRFYSRTQKTELIPAPSSRADSRPEHLGDGVHGHNESLFVLIFMEHMFFTILQATLELVKFTDCKIADGTMKRNRVIFPRGQTLARWLCLAIDIKGDEVDPDLDTPDEVNSDPQASQFNDPEHLSAANLWERVGNALRLISRILASDQSVFGFRAAAASMTVAILAYIHQTQEFFEEQRLIWALIIIVIGMSPNAGASIFSFIGRILGTVVSVVLSFAVWYIVDGHVPGVIVFLYVANVFEYYFYVKYPRFFGPSVISIVTMNIIVAYECQVKQLGIVEAESSGQPYYPIYLFGPYKLLCVAAGCLIAFTWTIFPYPVSARSQVRKVLGRSLFVLANFYSCMHTTIRAWITSADQSSESECRSLQLLDKARTKLFSEEMSLLTALRNFNHFTIYEPSIGGKFPKHTYDEIISQVQSIVISMALMAQTAKGVDTLFKSTSSAVGRKKEAKWLTGLAGVIDSTDFNAHIVTSLLCHLSAAICNGSALPPYLSAPEPFPLVRKLSKLNDSSSLLDLENAMDPGYSAFAALEVLSSMINLNLERLIGNVKLLVGEVTFEGYVNRKPRIPVAGASGADPHNQGDNDKID